MTVALIKQCIPMIFIRIGDDVLDELIDLTLHRMKIGARAQREIRERVVWSIIEAALDATAERMFWEWRNEAESND